MPTRGKQLPPSVLEGGKSLPSRASAAGDLQSVPEGEGQNAGRRSRKKRMTDKNHKMTEIELQQLRDAEKSESAKAEASLDSKGRKPADAAEEEAFMKSYNEIRKTRGAERQAEEEAASTQAKLTKARERVDEQSPRQQSSAPGDPSSLLNHMREQMSRESASSSSYGYPKARKEEPSDEPKAPSRMEAEASSGLSGAGGVKLPPLVRSLTSPGDLERVAGNGGALIARLQYELNAERLERERMADKVQELEKKLQRSSSQPAAKKQFFGTKQVSCYKVPPVPPPPPSSPKRTMALHLPALRTIPHSPNITRAVDEQNTRAAADAHLEKARNPEASRADRSRARTEAIGKLDNQGMSSWKERKAEKVARLNDLTVFRESMWGSFFEWHEDYGGT